MLWEIRTRLLQYKMTKRVYWSHSRLHRVELRGSSNRWEHRESSGTLLRMLYKNLVMIKI